MLKFYAGPRLKASFVAEPGPERMNKALESTRTSLLRLDELSRRAGFEYEIYLLVPAQDIMRDTYEDTLATLQGVAPSRSWSSRRRSCSSIRPHSTTMPSTGT